MIMPERPHFKRCPEDAEFDERHEEGRIVVLRKTSGIFIYRMRDWTTRQYVAVKSEPQ